MRPDHCLLPHLRGCEVLRRRLLKARHRNGDRSPGDHVRGVAHPGCAEQPDEGENGYDEASTHDSSSTVAAAGKRTSARVPPSSRFESDALPRHRCARVWTIARPSPVPGCELPALPRVKRSKRLVSSPGASPGPSSSTASQASLPELPQSTETRVGE